MDVRNATKQPTAQLDVPARSFVTGAIVAVGAAIGLTTTIELGIASSWWDEQRIVLLTALLVLTLIGAAQRGFANAAPPRITIAVGAVIALGLVSSLQAPRPFVASVEVATHAVLACFVLLFAGTPRQGLAAAAAIFAVAIAGPYTVGVVARYVSALLLSAPVGADTFLVGFANPRFPAHLQALTIPFLPLVSAAAPNRLSRHVIALVGALWWMCVFGSGSRTAWIALSCAAAVALFVQGPRSHWMRTQLRLASSGLVLYLMGFHLLPGLLGLPTEVETGRLANFSSLDTRLMLWSGSVDAIVAAPWRGLGPMHFAFDANPVATHPHNFWLQVAAEWGLPAGIAVAVLSFRLWWRTVMAARATSRARGEPDNAASTGLSLAVATAMTAWLVGIQLDGIMVVPTSQACSAVVLGLGLALTVPAARIDRPLLGRVVPAFILAAATALVVALPFSAFGHFEQRELSWRAANPTALLLPRFWQQGWIGPDRDVTAISPARAR